MDGSKIILSVVDIILSVLLNKQQKKKRTFERIISMVYSKQ